MLKNRRRYLRCNARLLIVIRVMDKENRRVWTRTGSTINVGGRGALLEVADIGEELIEELVKGNYVLQLAIKFPDFLFRIKSKAKVTWVEEVQKPGRNFRRFGVSFTDLPKRKETKAIDFVERYLASELADRSFKRTFEKIGESGGNEDRRSDQ